ncbi:hypothetical protein [Deinococcus sp. Marseille-Q6407]|uniref:hypothetical protein n=1 Tax=Deinococcus sp. Marseille-Q6407 TaxID=2969223 RepID=UPI0021C17DE3|nr:hypothetical protein [Deinococcus sp. Marseille-Q6407]
MNINMNPVTTATMHIGLNGNRGTIGLRLRGDQVELLNPTPAYEEFSLSKELLPARRTGDRVVLLHGTLSDAGFEVSHSDVFAESISPEELHGLAKRVPDLLKEASFTVPIGRGQLHIQRGETGVSLLLADIHYWIPEHKLADFCCAAEHQGEVSYVAVNDNNTLKLKSGIRRSILETSEQALILSLEQSYLLGRSLRAAGLSQPPASDNTDEWSVPAEF